MDAADSVATAASPGSRRPSPDSSSTRRVPVTLSIVPTTMNSGALNRPCASSMPIPAYAAIRLPEPNSTIRNPSWLTVPNASSRLRSGSVSARQPPSSIVASPSTTTGTHHSGRTANAGDSRATSTTPAFTIDAACR